jgi:hypothetical protein
MQALKKQVFENTYICIKPGMIELVQLSETHGVYNFLVVATLSATELPSFIDIFTKSMSEMRNSIENSPIVRNINSDGARCYVKENVLLVEDKLGKAIRFSSLRQAYMFLYQLQSCILATLFETQTRKELILQLVNMLAARNEAECRTLIKSWSNDLDLNRELVKFCLENNILDIQEQTVTISFLFLHSDIIEALYEIKKILSQTI